MAITELLDRYVAEEDIHVYSVDESFIDFTGTLSQWNNPEEIAADIQGAILRQFGRQSASDRTCRRRNWHWTWRQKRVAWHRLYQHANGIDFSELGASLVEGQVSYGKDRSCTTIT